MHRMQFIRITSIDIEMDGRLSIEEVSYHLRPSLSSATKDRKYGHPSCDEVFKVLERERKILIQIPNSPA